MIYKLIMLSEKQQNWGILLSAKNLTHSNAKKKNTFSQRLREFFKPMRHAVFYFLFYFFFLLQLAFASTHIPKPNMTEKFQLPYFQKSNGILHGFFFAPTCLNSSKTANFLRFL